MFVIWLILKLLVAIGCEAYGGYLLFFDPDSSGLAICLLHFASSVFAASCFALFLPDAVRDHYMLRASLFFVLMLLMPAFGLVGLLFFVLPALWFPKQHDRAVWKDVLIPELPFKPVDIDGKTVYGKGGLASVLNAAASPERRVQAVLAARQISDKLSIPLLQEALKDPVDDVRMFAYSLLDRKETEINERIAGLLQELDEKVDEGRIQYTLVQNYWELAFLGLATGNTLDYVLAEAEKHAVLAESAGWTGSDIKFLMGRIYLRQEKFLQAEQALQSSLAQGAVASTILPYLAEVAYEKRDFHQVRSILQRLQSCCDGNTPVPSVVHAWSVD